MIVLRSVPIPVHWIPVMNPIVTNREEKLLVRYVAGVTVSGMTKGIQWMIVWRSVPIPVNYTNRK